MTKEAQAYNSDFVSGRICERFPDAVHTGEVTYGMLTLTVKAEYAHDIISYLKEDPDMNFGFLTTLCGIHYPDSELPLGVIYHLHNMEKRFRLRIKTFLPLSKPEIRTLTDIFSTANWMEREAYDFYGILFVGHPYLKRILNVEYMDYFPMRREYQLEDPTRKDKDDRFFGR
jgi:NADH-quinone oxidoreductase subunit C